MFMGIVNDLLKDVPLPRMARVRQQFDDRSVGDVEAAVREAVRPLGAAKKGMRIAVGVGSRGIADLEPIVRSLVSELRRAGAAPFAVPAMGSHGGATAEGQLEVLRNLGVTEKSIGCPIVSSMATATIGLAADGRPVRIDASAAAADGIVVVNRIKPHTSFAGRYESGLMKMLAVGLAKRAGADACHQEGYARMAANVEKYGNAVLSRAKVLFGLAIIENAYSRTAEITALKAGEIAVREPELLSRARELLPRILLRPVDVLVVDRMGKEISGLGMDPHVTGCFASPYAEGPPRPDKLVALDLTAASRGNANGVGVADVITARLRDKFDPDTTYPNAITATLAPAVRLPMALDNQKLAIQAGIKMAAGFDKKNIRLVRIRDTLHVGEIEISEAILGEARRHPRIGVLGEPEALPFDPAGNLF
jgi:hypothetical protein